MADRCSVIYGDVFARHDMDMHRESSARLRLAISGVPEGITRLEPRQATYEDLTRVHQPNHIRMIQEICSYGDRRYIDMNTYVTEDSFEVASYAAGGSIQATEQTFLGEHSFALVRPPGHHAEPDRAMGFCIFNNAAVAAAKALDTVERVVIVDWDLHHGNGTQKIFYRSDRVLYCSIHQGNIFPRTGWADEIGEGRGKGFTINAPIRAGATIADYFLVFNEVFRVAIENFKPGLLIISAGQDPLADDPIGSMRLRPEDFGVLTRILMESSKNPLAVVLEGGYGPSLGEAVAHIFRVLQGDLPEIPDLRPRVSTVRLVRDLKKMVM
jgi:acetoin utilization deacetylase AcuC-like enzyme